MLGGRARLGLKRECSIDGVSGQKAAGDVHVQHAGVAGQAIGFGGLEFQGDRLFSRQPMVGGSGSDHSCALVKMGALASTRQSCTGC